MPNFSVLYLCFCHFCAIGTFFKIILSVDIRCRRLLSVGFVVSGSFKCKSEAKQVMFSDGIRPGGDLTEVDGVGRLRSASANVVRQTERVGKPGEQSNSSE